jgi:hypothetical protein
MAIWNSSRKTKGLDEIVGLFSKRQCLSMIGGSWFFFVHARSIQPLAPSLALMGVDQPCMDHTMWPTILPVATLRVTALVALLLSRWCNLQRCMSMSVWHEWVWIDRSLAQQIYIYILGLTIARSHFQHIRRPELRREYYKITRVQCIRSC